MLKGELDAHLDCNEHDRHKEENARSCNSSKKIKTSYGEDKIKVPRDPEGSFNPMLIPKREKLW